MLKIFFSITTKKISINEIINSFNNTIIKDFNICIACEKNHQIVEEFSNLKDKKLPIELNIFSVGTSEEAMINWSIKQFEKCDLILVRNNCQNFSSNVVENLLSESLKGYDVVMLKSNKKIGKIKQFFIDLGNKLCKTFFNFSHYSGDIGIQFFSEQAVSILQTTNVNLLSKLNRWVALNVGYIEMDIVPTKFEKKSYKKQLIFSILYGVALVITISISIIFKNIPFLLVLVLILAYAVEISLGAYHILEIFSIKKVGAINFKQDDAIEIRK